LEGVDGEKYAGHRGQKQQVSHEAAYFNCDEIEEKVVLSFVPRPFTTLMIATEMPAAIRPYSMAVAPDSSAKNWRHFAIMAGNVEPPRKI
jgi:hypothetical protein